MTAPRPRALATALARSRPTANHTAAAPRYSTTAPQQPDPASILSRPTWSVRSLLPQETTTTTAAAAAAAATRVTPSELRHLLRLSALPAPASAAEEARMISELQAQLRFVRGVQAVDVAGVEPLRSIRDETAAGLAEATVGVEALRRALDAEEAVGRARRPRRPRAPVDTAGAEDWDPLQTASYKAGRYFVVRSAKTET